VKRKKSLRRAPRRIGGSLEKGKKYRPGSWGPPEGKRLRSDREKKKKREADAQGKEKKPSWAYRVKLSPAGKRLLLIERAGGVSRRHQGRRSSPFPKGNTSCSVKNPPRRGGKETGGNRRKEKLPRHGGNRGRRGKDRGLHRQAKVILPQRKRKLPSVTRRQKKKGSNPETGAGRGQISALPTLPRGPPPPLSALCSGKEAVRGRGGRKGTSSFAETSLILRWEGAGGGGVVDNQVHPVSPGGGHLLLQRGGKNVVLFGESRRIEGKKKKKQTTKRGPFLSKKKKRKDLMA